MSLLSWERGLKWLSDYSQGNGENVAPLVGAWIEIHMEADGICLPSRSSRGSVD